MNIQDLKEKSKLFRENIRDKFPKEENASRYYTALIIVLVGLSSFGLGRLSILEDSREPIIIENSFENSENVPSTIPNVEAVTQSASVATAVNDQLLNVKGTENAPLAPGGKIVASKNGTKYYFPWCASNIAEKNKIWFNSEAEARAKGLQPAANCKGLK